MERYALILLIGFISSVGPIASCVEESFVEIKEDVQIVSDELSMKLKEHGNEYKDAAWPKDINSKKVDLTKVPDEILQSAINWMKTMIKDRYLPKEIKTKWILGVHKEDEPSADYLVLRYKIGGHKIQIQENGIAVCVLIEPNSVSDNPKTEEFVSNTIYEFLNYPKDKTSLKFYLENFDCNHEKIYFGTVDCAFDKNDKHAWGNRTWWNHTYIWTDGKKLYLALVEMDRDKQRGPKQPKPGITRRFLVN